ncbi:unnamed protein product [Cladocopium goreaui]|uniref:Geranylgeranyl diphosphate reductase, chloroplastic n=1 Tax=Cladocopium goreaui TaxID=2562237 RepID=A0A9P1GBS1_9DINO|nr:unnamed protein product [Cladocopium goreaui]
MKLEEMLHVWQGLVRFSKDHRNFYLKARPRLQPQLSSMSIRQLLLVLRGARDLRHSMADLHGATCAALLPRVNELLPSEAAACLTFCIFSPRYRSQAMSLVKSITEIWTSQDLTSLRVVEAVDALECLASWNLRPVAVLERLDGILVDRLVELKYTGNISLWVVATQSLASLRYREASWPLLALELASDKVFLEKVPLHRQCELLAGFAQLGLFDAKAFRNFAELLLAEKSHFKDSKDMAKVLMSFAQSHFFHEEIFDTLYNLFLDMFQALQLQFCLSPSVTMSGVMAAVPSVATLRTTGVQPAVHTGVATQVAAPSSAHSSGLSACGLAAVGLAATAAARSRRSSLVRGQRSVVPVRPSRSLSSAKVVVCAGVNFPEGRKLRVAVVGGGPAGASAADQLAKDGVETFLIERKMDNCKPCGGAIPLCMIDEFDLPKDIVDRQVRKMTMISPTNKEVQIGQTLKDDEFIGMVRREVLDDFLRQRAKTNGATLINGLFMGMALPEKKGDSYVLTYNDYEDEQGNARKGVKKTLEVDVVIGADGANSRVAKDIEAGDYEYAIAFQERMKIPEQKMDYYKERAEMYVGEDVSPDFYAWVFPKCDHVAVGTGTVIDKKGIQRYQQGIRDRAAPRIDGGEIIRVEAHPIPEHPRPWRVKDRAILVGDAAGYVTKCSGEGIYFAAKSGRMCAKTIVKNSKQGVRMIDEADLMEHLREWDGKYGPTYLVLDLLQKVFYTSDAARESFVELCEEEYVQKVTFDSYLYKTVQGNDPVGDLKLGWKTLSSLYKYNNQKTPDPMRTLA